MCNEMRFCLHLYKHKLSLLGLRAKASIRNAYLLTLAFHNKLCLYT